MFIVRCPSCGAEVKFLNAGFIFAVCDFCQSTLVRNDKEALLLGKMSALKDDFSPMQRGTEGIYNGEHFTIVGRVRFQWKQGVWDEWALFFDDGNIGWLCDAQGFYGITFSKEFPESFKNWHSLATGTAVYFDKIQYKIDDIKEASCLYSEGVLPYTAVIGRRSVTADLTAENGLFASLQYPLDSKEAPSFSVGAYKSFNDLKFSNVKSFDGW